MDSADGVFFSKGADFNQGTFHTWMNEEALWGMAKAELKVGQVNTEGQKLADEFSYSRTVDTMLAKIFKN